MPISTQGLRHRDGLDLVIRVGLSIVALVVAIIGCGPSRAETVRVNQAQSLSDDLVDAVAASHAGDRLDMGQVLSGNWSRFVVFPAYSSNTVALDTLGFAFDIESTPIQSSDGTDVIVLATDAAVVHWFTVAESDVNLDVGSVPLLFPRRDAVFEISVTATGDRALVPVESTLPS